MILGAVQRLRTTARALGTGWALLYALHRLVQRISRGRMRIVPYAIVAQPLGSVALKTVRDDASTQVFEAAPDSWPLQDFPRPESVLRQRWQDGARCFVATVHGKFAGTIWVAPGAYEEDEVRCQYLLADPARTVWDFDVYVSPTHRLGRTMARMWKAVDATLVGGGYGWTISRISLFNPGSIGAHARLGAVEISKAVFVVCGPIQLMLSTRPVRVHLGWGATSRPILQLAAPAARAPDAVSPKLAEPK